VNIIQDAQRTTTPVWRKSSRSGTHTTGNCIEAAVIPNHPEPPRPHSGGAEPLIEPPRRETGERPRYGCAAARGPTTGLDANIGDQVDARAN
jgi:hypothetical protein